MSAMTMLAAGPAAVTHTMLGRGLRMLRASTGTGFAQPNRKPPSQSSNAGTSTVPIGSMWRIGLRLSRPCISAVRSPNCLATQPCATSWTVIAKTTGIAAIEIVVRNEARSMNHPAAAEGRYSPGLQGLYDAAARLDRH